MTAPLTPANCDLRGLPYMPLDVVRLMDSDLFALSTGDEFKAAVALWARSWGQVPAASLPNDERVLARLVGLSLALWRKVREQALRGWQECSDDRLYHPVVAEKALGAWLERLTHRKRSAAGNAKRYGREVDEREFSDAMEAALACLKRVAPAAAAAFGNLPQGAQTPPTGSENAPSRTPTRSEIGSEEKGRDIPVGRTSPPAHPQEAWQRVTVLLVSHGRLTDPKARNFFGGLLRDHKLEPADMLPSIVKAEALGTADPQGYLTAAAKALSSRRPGVSASSSLWGDDEWRTAYRLWKLDGSWSDDMGPQPGEPGCRVPQAILLEAA